MTQNTVEKYKLIVFQISVSKVRRAEFTLILSQSLYRELFLWMGIFTRLNMFMMRSTVLPISFSEGPPSKLKFESSVVHNESVCRFP